MQFRNRYTDKLTQRQVTVCNHQNLKWPFSRCSSLPPLYWHARVATAHCSKSLRMASIHWWIHYSSQRCSQAGHVSHTSVFW